MNPIRLYQIGKPSTNGKDIISTYSIYDGNGSITMSGELVNIDGFLFHGQYVSTDVFDKTLANEITDSMNRIEETFNQVTRSVHLADRVMKKIIKIGNFVDMDTVCKGYDYNGDQIPNDKIDIRFVDQVLITLRLNTITCVRSSTGTILYPNFRVTNLRMYEGMFLFDEDDPILQTHHRTCECISIPKDCY